MGSNTIYAFEKAGRIEMCNLVYSDKNQLQKSAKSYISKGFKVHYVMVG